MCRALPSLIAATLLASVAASPARAARPRLGVVIVFDQLSSWLADQGEPFYGPGGFGGLDGARYDAWYNFASTETAPGHATIATCAQPSVHGIATNTWLHDGKPFYVVEDERFPVLAPTPTDPRARLSRGVSPRMLRVPTLGDAMKIDSGGRAKVITLSHKDRAAALSGGQTADLAIWYDRELGRYTTSTAYADVLPAWLEAHGAALPAAARSTATWVPLEVPKDLAALVPADDRPGEGGVGGFGATFPHHLRDLATDEEKKNAYRASPQSIDDVFALALLAVEHEGLGQDAEPDLLVVSVSTTDVIGHNYGGDSLEALDVLRRSDAAVRRFVAELKKKVRGDVPIVITADHGAPPLPQTMEKAGMNVVPLSYEVVVGAADEALKRVAPRKDGSSRVQAFFPPQMFVDFADLDAAGVERAIAAVTAAVEATPGIAAIYDMRDGKPDRDEFHWLMRASAPPGRAAAIFVRQEPRVVLIEQRYLGKGTDHGSVYTYDRRVPFFLAGPGVKRGRHSDHVDVRDVSPSLAFMLAVSPPDACQGRPVGALRE